MCISFAMESLISIFLNEMKRYVTKFHRSFGHKNKGGAMYGNE